jgi:glycosyltransferase involved in cell wall biosynthesis
MIRKLVAPKSEAEIISNWIHVDNVYVSIICITFNQEIYIQDAIDSFLSQVTDFKFEIVIHDDASTDSTPAILARYQKIYPNIIKLILQTDNKYSESGYLPFKYATSKSKGEYIALCEGDDFWIDSYKLQKQVDILKQGKYSLIGHDAICLNEISGKQRMFCVKSGFYNTEDILKNNWLMPTASITCTAKYLKGGVPSWFENAYNIDYCYQLYLSIFKPVYIMPDIMSVYRESAINSLSEQNYKKMETVKYRMIRTLFQFNEFYKRKYFSSIVIKCIKIFKEILIIKVSRSFLAKPLKKIRAFIKA